MRELHPLQEWEGYVVEIGEAEFVARLVDLTAGLSHETEEATIPLNELSDPDRAKVEVGGFFRWVIGYEHSPKGGTGAGIEDRLSRPAEDDRRRPAGWQGVGRQNGGGA